MSNDDQSGGLTDEAVFDGSFEGTARRQRLLGLELDAGGRLQWLEETMAELRNLCGRASSADSDTRRTG